MIPLSLLRLRPADGVGAAQGFKMRVERCALREVDSSDRAASASFGGARDEASSTDQGSASFAALYRNIYNSGVDFERVLDALITEFDRLHVRYAAIGGFALGLLGVPRATMDLDFLVHRDDISKLHGLFTALGYERHAYTENVSQYRHRDRRWGSVDFVHAFRKASLSMLRRAKSYPVFEKERTVKAVDPEDLIGLKVQAMANDPDRRPQEVADIEGLAKLLGAKLDWERIQEYYNLFGLGPDAKQLRKRFGRAH